MRTPTSASGFVREMFCFVNTSAVATAPFGITTPKGPMTSSATRVVNVSPTLDVLLQTRSSLVNSISDPAGMRADARNLFAVRDVEVRGRACDVGAVVALDAIVVSDCDDMALERRVRVLRRGVELTSA